MTKILTTLETKALDDHKYVELTKPFIFISSILEKYDYHFKIVVPTCFVFDFESVPIIKGTSKRAGLCHDYLYRINSLPIVPKHIADKVYLEIMEYRKNPAWRRWIKYSAVKWFGKSSYHKLLVEDSYETIIGI